MPRSNRFSPLSRRSFLQWSAVASSGAALGAITEPMLARAAVDNVPKDAIFINANENPLGPCSAAREAITAIIPQGGRYQSELTDALAEMIAQKEGLKPEYLAIFPGSSEPLHFAILSYTSPTKSYVTADPGYEAGMYAAKVSGARIAKVALTKDYAHDMKAMIAAAPDAGLFYVCTPNNPTGTTTSHADIEYLLENKPSGSVVLVDEAYIHFSEAPSAIDLVKAGKDLIVLRTFSKIYGMAGLRCGFAVARPDLLSKLTNLAGWNAQPVTAVSAALASLQDAGVVPERKRINATVRDRTFAWLESSAYSYIRSQTNFFMLDTKQSAKSTIEAMARQNVIIGRSWPAMPTWVRITVGTQPEMEQFQSAFKKVMNGTVMGKMIRPLRRRHESLDGLLVPPSDLLV